MTGGILVFSEIERGTFELLTKGRELSKAFGMELSALAIRKKDGTLQPYFEYGAQRVLLLPNDGNETLDTDAYAHILFEVAKENGPDIVIVRSTRIGKEVAGRVAQKLQAGCITDALNLAAKNSELVVDRYAFGGNTISSQSIKTKKKVISVMPGAVEAQPAPVQGKIETLSITTPPKRVELVQRKPKVGESVNIESAENLVCVGKGLSAKEDLGMVKDLCAALKAELGCTRALSSDYHWISEDRMVGISGKKCKPRLHVSIGISGQIQHTVGIMSSKLIIAINKDKDAPIFKMADYGIVGDLYQLVPKLTQKIQAQGG
jgi:electron transfer flavoprotein alpha subunit